MYGIDPAAVKDLALELAYHGGIVVYLNGQEILRQNVPAGAITAATLAEPYGLDSYLAASGDLPPLAIDTRLAPRDRSGSM